MAYIITNLMLVALLATTLAFLVKSWCQLLFFERHSFAASIGAVLLGFFLLFMFLSISIFSGFYLKLMDFSDSAPLLTSFVISTLIPAFAIYLVLKTTFVRAYFVSTASLISFLIITFVFLYAAGRNPNIQEMQSYLLGQSQSEKGYPAGDTEDVEESIYQYHQSENQGSAIDDLE